MLADVPGPSLARIARADRADHRWIAWSGAGAGGRVRAIWSEDRNLRSRRTGVARARQQLEDLGAVVCAVPCDVSKPEEVDNLISSVTRHMGEIDVLVNNAGVIS